MARSDATGFHTPATTSKNPILQSSGPGRSAIAATASTTYTECRSVWVGTGGDITFTLADAGTAIFKNISDGTLIPIRVTVWADYGGSGATDIVFIY